LLLLFQFKYERAVALSLSAVVGNVLGQTFVNFDRRHPADPARPLIYWDCVLVLLPAQIGGGNIGVIMATMFPETILVILAMLVLSSAGLSALEKGLLYYKAETAAKKVELEPPPDAPEEKKKESIDDGIAQALALFPSSSSSSSSAPPPPPPSSSPPPPPPPKSALKRSSLSLQIPSDIEAGGRDRDGHEISPTLENTYGGGNGSGSSSSSSSNGSSSLEIAAPLSSDYSPTRRRSVSDSPRVVERKSFNRKSLSAENNGNGGADSPTSSTSTKSTSSSSELGDAADSFEHVNPLSGGQPLLLSSSPPSPPPPSLSESPDTPNTRKSRKSVGFADKNIILHMRSDEPPSKVSDGSQKLPPVMNDGVNLNPILVTSKRASSPTQLYIQSSNQVTKHDNYKDYKVDKDDNDSRASLFANRPTFMAPRKQTAAANVKMNWPWVNLKVLAVVWVLYAALFILLHDAVKPCTAGYFGLLGSSYVPLGLVIFWAVRHISKTQNLKPDIVLEGDLHFSKIGFMPPVFSFFIGILCSLLGIGGGELMGPLLLSMKIKPQVSSATTSVMSLLSSSLAVIHFIIRGTASFEWTAIAFCIGLIAGLSGRMLAIYITKKYNRPSLLIFILTFVLGISLCLLIFHITTEVSDFDLHGFC
jgi:uncharacterized membrane protein YfcA